MNLFAARLSIDPDKTADFWVGIAKTDRQSPEWVYGCVEASILDLQIPEIRCEAIMVKAIGEGRKVLRIGDRRIKDHDIYVSANREGKLLTISRGLIIDSNVFKRAVANMGENMDRRKLAPQLTYFENEQWEALCLAVNNILNSVLQTMAREEEWYVDYVGS